MICVGGGMAGEVTRTLFLIRLETIFWMIGLSKASMGKQTMQFCIITGALLRRQ
jgi:hypothetical protein